MHGNCQRDPFPQTRNNSELVVMLSPDFVTLANCQIDRKTNIDQPILYPHQHDFRLAYNTTTSLHIVQAISRGLNHKQPFHRTVVIALDLT